MSSDAWRGGSHGLSLYVHVPFCFHKCHYCDFYSIVDAKDRMPAFAARLGKELLALGEITGRPLLSSVFIGGGTPTLLDPASFRGVVDAVSSSFTIGDACEWTTETNPETLTEGIAGVLVESGINRVSMGAQSFNTKHLKTLERHHDPDSVERAVAAARSAGIERVSVDLIYAVPGQTLAEWEQDLARALALGTEHLSAYELTYEPNTAMTARRDKGEFREAGDDLGLAMNAAALEAARAHGLERYEVSNFARPGAECAHNLAYWRNGDWLAAGPGAAGHLGGYRWTNTPRLEDYLAMSDGGFAPVRVYETPDAARTLSDTLMMGIRVREGLEVDRIRALALPLGCFGDLEDVAARLARQGIVEITQERWALTNDGYAYTDYAARELIGAVPGS